MCVCVGGCGWGAGVCQEGFHSIKRNRKMKRNEK